MSGSWSEHSVQQHVPRPLDAVSFPNAFHSPFPVRPGGRPPGGRSRINVHHLIYTWDTRPVVTIGRRLRPRVREGVSLRPRSSRRRRARGRRVVVAGAVRHALGRVGLIGVHRGRRGPGGIVLRRRHGLHAVDGAWVVVRIGDDVRVGIPGISLGQLAARDEPLGCHVSTVVVRGHGPGARGGRTRWYPRGTKPFFIRLRACHRPTKIQVNMRTMKPRKMDHLIMMPVCTIGQSRPVHGPVDDPAVERGRLALECQKGTITPSSSTHPGGSSSSLFCRRCNFRASIITVPTRGRGMFMTAIANVVCGRACV